MHRDLELASGGLGHVVGKLLHVLGLETGHAIGGGQVPLGLSVRHGGQCAEGTGQGCEQFFHGIS